MKHWHRRIHSVIWLILIPTLAFIFWTGYNLIQITQQDESTASSQTIFLETEETLNRETLNRATLNRADEQESQPDGDN